LLLSAEAAPFMYDIQPTYDERHARSRGKWWMSSLFTSP